MPADILQQLLVAQSACNNLSGLATGIGLDLAFTLDGRFVGDLGELLAVRFFQITLFPNQKAQHDGTCQINGANRIVQIKCRRASTVIDISSQPDLLLVLRIDADWQNWEVVYNGEGSFLTGDKGYSVNNKGHLMKNGQKTARRLQLEDLYDQPSTIEIPPIVAP